jgi:acetylornithine deacetylase/succinyl-diaminopimelate desuccinylase-like protein
VQADFEARLDAVRQRVQAEIRLDLVKTRDGFGVRADEPVVRALQQAYWEVTGRALPVGGLRAVGDAECFVNQVGVPAVYLGVGLERGHATPEWVKLEHMEQLSRVLSQAALRYLGAMV